LPMPRTVGVLGGMGPEASAVFLQYLIRLTPAARDQDHIPVILAADPSIPDRTAFLLGSGESPLPRLTDLAGVLERAGADLIVVPCNTAHVFWADIARAVAVPVLHIVDETIRRIEPGEPGMRVGLLATRGTIASGLYQSALDAVGYHPVLPTEDLQGEAQAIIEGVKGGGDRSGLTKRLHNLIDRFVERGAERLILGCTELGLVLGPDPGLPVTDSLWALAEATVEQAGM
jgi:aspartate racemase